MIISRLIRVCNLSNVCFSEQLAVIHALIEHHMKMVPDYKVQAKDLLSSLSLIANHWLYLIALLPACRY